MIQEAEVLVKKKLKEGIVHYTCEELRFFLPCVCLSFVECVVNQFPTHLVLIQYIFKDIRKLLQNF